MNGPKKKISKWKDLKKSQWINQTIWNQGNQEVQTLYLPDLGSVHHKISKSIWSHQKLKDTADHPNPQTFCLSGPMQGGKTTW